MTEPTIQVCTHCLKALCWLGFARCLESLNREAVEVELCRGREKP